MGPVRGRPGRRLETSGARVAPVDIAVTEDDATAAVAELGKDVVVDVDVGDSDAATVDEGRLRKHSIDRIM